MVSVLDPRLGRLAAISYVNGEPPHHWEHDISFIDGWKQCLTLSHYPGSGYRLFDIEKRKFIKDYKEYEKKNQPQITMNLEPIDSMDLSHGRLSAIKVTPDKKHIIRGYVSGRVVLSDYDTYIRLFNQLGIYYSDKNK